jgi:hypothetical protein
MLTLVRAGLAAALLAVALSDQAGSPDQERGRTGRQVGRPACEPMPTPPSSAADFRTGLQILGQIAATTPTTAPTGCGWPAPFSRSRLQPPSRPSCWSGPRPRPTSPISAPAMRARRPMRWRCSAGAVRAQAVASGAGCVAAVARPARSRRRARPIREAARRAWLPAAGLHRRFRFGVAAGLFPVLRGPRQAHRFRAVRGAGRQRQAGAVVGRTSSSASTASSTASATTSTCAPGCRPPSRKPCRNRPNSTSMCATASRSCASPDGPMCCRAPASAAFPWSASIPRGVGQRVPDRRPQPDQHRDRQRFPAALSKATSFPSLGDERGVKVWSGELATASHAQPGRHHGVSGRSGARRVCSPASMS